MPQPDPAVRASTNPEYRQHEIALFKLWHTQVGLQGGERIIRDLGLHC